MKTLREILDNWHGKGATIVLEDLEPHLLAWAKAYGEQVREACLDVMRSEMSDSYWGSMTRNAYEHVITRIRAMKLPDPT